MAPCSNTEVTDTDVRDSDYRTLPTTRDGRRRLNRDRPPGFALCSSAAGPGEQRSVSLLLGIGVNSARYREILGIWEGATEDKAGWSGFLCTSRNLLPNGRYGTCGTLSIERPIPSATFIDQPRQSA
jgi:hypothetical protein